MRVFDVGIGVVSDEKLDDIEISSARSPLHGGSHEVAS